METSEPISPVAMETVEDQKEASRSEKRNPLTSVNFISVRSIDSNGNISHASCFEATRYGSIFQICKFPPFLHDFNLI